MSGCADPGPITSDYGPMSEDPGDGENAPQGDNLYRYELEFPAMGVTFKFTGYADDEEVAKTAFDAARKRIDEIESAITSYNPDSEAMRLTASAPHSDPVPVSNDLWAMLRYSDRHFLNSHGTFDPTIGKVIDLWRRARQERILPRNDRIADALNSSGMDNVQLGNKEAYILVEGMKLDFGGLGKGYAADQAVQVLRSNGVKYCLVDASGDIRCTDAAPGRQSWRVEMNTGMEIKTQTLSLVNMAVATSGDINQFVNIDGERYSHIIDPRTGMAITGSRAVTVLAQDAITADALASSVAVLGQSDGFAMIEQWPDVEARMVWQDEQGRVMVKLSSGFPRPPKEDEPSDD